MVRTPSARRSLRCASSLSSSDRSSLFSLSNVSFLTNACNELKSHDKTGVGLLSLSAFSLCLSHMGISYGSPEADLLLRFCLFTKDGFVLFKPLITETDPFKKQHTDTVALSLTGPDEGPPLVGAPLSLLPTTAEAAAAAAAAATKTEGLAYVRRLFAQWERCLLKDRQLKECLVLAGFKITPEFERLLVLKGPGGSVRFKDFISCLLKDRDYTSDSWCSSSSRRGDTMPLELLNAATAEIAKERVIFTEPQRDAVSWRPAAAAAAPAAAAGARGWEEGEWLGPAFVRNEPWKEKPLEVLKGEERRTALLHFVSLFMSGAIGDSSFRDSLDKMKYIIDDRVSAAIKEQTAGGSVSFQRLVGCIGQAELERKANKKI